MTLRNDAIPGSVDHAADHNQIVAAIQELDSRVDAVGVLADYEADAAAAAAAAVVSQNAAAASAVTASSAAGTATTQAGNASTSAGTATSQASAAGVSAAAALASQNAAASSAGTATTQAGIATTQAGLATTERVNAGVSAGVAEVEANAAAASAAAALVSQNAAAGSQSAASGSASAAAASALLAAASAGGTGPVAWSGSSASPIVSITQTGAGPALLVEDSASTDSTPFVIDATGKVGVGTASPTANLHVKADWISNEGQISADVPSGGTYSGMTMQNDGTIKGLAIWDNSGSQLLLSVPATTGKVVLGYNSTSPQISADMSTGATSIYGSGTERFKIDADGLITGTGTSLGAWTAYTPTLGGTGWAIGDGAAYGHYCRVGKIVHFRVLITLGATSTAGAGIATITGPVTSANTVTYSEFQTSYYDASGTTIYTGAARMDANSTTIRLRAISSSVGALTAVVTTTPFTWATTDSIIVSGTYEAA